MDPEGERDEGIKEANGHRSMRDAIKLGTRCIILPGTAAHAMTHVICLGIIPILILPATHSTENLSGDSVVSL